MRLLPLARLAVVAALGLGAVAAAPSGAKTGAPAFGSGAAGFVVSAAPAGLAEVDNAGEPSLGISWKTGRGLYMSGTSTYKLKFDTRATPPTVSWSDVSSPYSLFNLDPILATDRETGATLAGGDNGGCSLLSRTQDDGESWAPAVPCTGLIDHPTVGLGPFRGSPPVGASGKVAAYYCQQYPVLNQCARSLDGGTTWSPAVTVLGCTSLFGHLKVGPDGTAFVPSNSCTAGTANGVGGFASSDNGLTWYSYVIPGATTPSRGFDPSVASTTDGALYESWTRDGDSHPAIAVSRDAGKTWTKPLDLAGTVSPALAGSTFPTVVAGGPGRAAVAFLGTRHVPAKGTSAYDDKQAVWDLYVSMTYDGGRTWKTTQVTSDPVQRGTIADGGTLSGADRNLLDFMDAGVTPDGRVVVGFADGCTARGGCTEDGAGPNSSRDAHATVALQAGGRGLLARYDS